MEVTHKQLRLVLRQCYKKHVPIDIKGAPGIGKSEVVLQSSKEIAESEGKELIIWNDIPLERKQELVDDPNLENCFIVADFRLSQMDPTDLKGFPKIDGRYVNWVPNLIFKVLSRPKAFGLVFFDEMNLAAPSVMASCYQIINDNQVGETPISKNVFFVSAGNRLTDKANVHEEPAPLRNRRLNVTLNPPAMASKDGDDWQTWAMEHDVDTRIITFLSWKEGSYLFKFDEDSLELSFPSPRMWKKCSDLIKDVKEENTLKLYIGASVGQGIARELIAFMKLNQVIRVQELLAHPEKMEQFNGRDYIDTKYSIVGAVAEVFFKDNTILDKAIALCNHMEVEYGMFFLKMLKLMYKGANFSRKLTACSNWRLIAKTYEDYIM